MERKPRRTGGPARGSLSPSPYPNIEWVIANEGSITIGEVGADVGCVAAAADPHQCYAMLARRHNESLLDIMGRLDRAIATAAESGDTVDEINPPGGFEPPPKTKSRRP